MLLVDVNTPAGLLASAVFIHRLLVPSRKYFNGAAMLPKYPGLPTINPAQLSRSVSRA